jgi:hypothetical protein
VVIGVFVCVVVFVAVVVFVVVRATGAAIGALVHVLIPLVALRHAPFVF